MGFLNRRMQVRHSRWACLRAARALEGFWHYLMETGAYEVGVR
jgi:hypothetical protein